MSITLIFTVGVSILAYYVTISFLSEQVNVKLIDTEFAKKIGIIVACSWLTVYVMHKFKNCCFPPYQDKVLRGEISHKDDILGQTYNPRMTARTFGDLVDHTQAPTGGSRYGDQPAVPTEVEPLL